MKKKKGKSDSKLVLKKLRIPISKKEFVSAVITKPALEKPLPLIIFLTGSGGVKERFEIFQKHFSKKGYICVAFDFRGRGESDGKSLQNTLLDQIDDTKAVFNFMLKKERINKNKVTLFGHSMGGFIAASVANEISPNDLILSAPALYMPNVEKKPQADINKYAREVIPKLKGKTKRARALKEIAKYKGNLKVIEHEFDQIIPEWLCMEYYERAKKVKNKKYQVLKNVGHAVLKKEDWKRSLILVVNSWLEETG